MKARTITDLLWLKIHMDLPALHQYPRKRVSATDKIWYERRPLGINKLGSLMKEISSGAELSRMYTNHSVRATCITLLSKANVPSRHIMAISGHQSETTLQHYNQRPSQFQFYEVHQLLHQLVRKTNMDDHAPPQVPGITARQH